MKTTIQELDKEKRRLVKEIEECKLCALRKKKGYIFCDKHLYTIEYLKSFEVK